MRGRERNTSISSRFIASLEPAVNTDFNLPLLADEILPVFVPVQSKPTAPMQNLAYAIIK